MNVASLAEDGTGRWKKEGGHHRCFIHLPVAEAQVRVREVLKSTFAVNQGPKPPSSLCNASGPSLPVPAGRPHRSQRPIPEHSVCKEPGVASSFSGRAVKSPGRKGEPGEATKRSPARSPTWSPTGRGRRPAAGGMGRARGLTHGG